VSGPLDFPDPEEREAGEEPAEAAPEGPARSPSPPERPSTARRRYAWIVGVAAVVALGWISLNALRGEGGGGPTGVEPGTALPPFAAPLALSRLDGDANVARHADSGPAGQRPACGVRGPDVLNVCQLAERGPVVLAFLATRGGDCTGELDRLEALRRDFPGVQVAAVSIRGDRDDVRALIRRHGWGFPVGYDRDGALARIYGVAVCPQVTYAYPGGEVRETVIGEESEPALRERLTRLVERSEARGWTPPTSSR
jgi:hypothetical protein